MSDVPDDIRAAAVQVAKRWFHEEWGHDEHIQNTLIGAIALALMAERERCAKYIESVYDYDTESIAAAIRRGDHTGF